MTISADDSQRSKIDLGRIEVEASLGPQPGEPVPDFEYKLVDGSTARLSDLRGKYVLMDFWATWCTPCLAKLPDVERIHRTNLSSGRFAVVGMNLDKDESTARKFLKSRDLSWQQGLLGDWDTTPVPKQLGISSVPAYLLIDPQGRLLRRSSDVAQLEETVKELIRNRNN